ncbi:MAG: ABC transporter permease, partial [Phycisphaerales bacterium]
SQNQVFERIAAYNVHFAYVTGIDRPRKITSWAVSPDLFRLLGVETLLGREFFPQEDRKGNEHVVVLSYAFWQTHFGGSPDAIGRTIYLTTDNIAADGGRKFDRQGYSVVGIMPQSFEFPFGRPAPFWIPLVLETDGTEWRSNSPVLRVLARPRDGVGLEQARGAMAVIGRRLHEMDPKAAADRAIGVDWLLNRILRGNRRPLLLLLGAAGFVLLIACSNVANLFLARAAERQREVAMRSALGASRGRIVRQMLTESLLLSAVAGVLGLVLTFYAVRALVHLCPSNIPRLHDTSVDLSVLYFTLATSILTALLFGMVPAWRGSGIRVSETLKEGAGRATGGRGWRRLHGGLVVSQLGLSLVLLIGAALLIRSLIALQRVDLGFQPKNVLAVHVDLPEVKYPESHHCRAFFEPLVQRTRTLPHVRSAGLITGDLDLGTGGMTMDIAFPDRPAEDASQDLAAKYAIVTPGFFEALGLKLLTGRIFEEQETAVTIIDENLARKHFADVDPVGRKIIISEGEFTIVGVVNTLKDFQTLDPTDGAVYMPLGSYVPGQMVLVVRTDGDPMRLADAIRTEVAGLSGEEVVAKIETPGMILSKMLAPRRFSMVLLGLFAGIAVVIAVAGVYGLLEYSTSQQTREIAIRVALGAEGAEVRRMVLWRGLRLTLIGIALGVVGAVAVTRVLASLLYDVSPTDPLTLASVSLVLTVIALFASYLPARRAAKVDPMVALRCE